MTFYDIQKICQSNSVEYAWSNMKLDWSDISHRRAAVRAILPACRRSIAHISIDFDIEHSLYPSLEKLQKWCDGDDTVPEDYTIGALYAAMLWADNSASHNYMRAAGTGVAGGMLFSALSKIRSLATRRVIEMSRLPDYLALGDELLLQQRDLIIAFTP